MITTLLPTHAIMWMKRNNMGNSASTLLNNITMKGITIQPQEKGVQNDKNGIKLEACLVIIEWKELQYNHNMKREYKMTKMV